jgi:hypothetical protein
MEPRIDETQFGSVTIDGKVFTPHDHGDNDGCCSHRPDTATQRSHAPSTN